MRHPRVYLIMEEMSHVAAFEGWKKSENILVGV